MTWTGHYTSTGTSDRNAPLVITSDTLPANSLLRGVVLSVDADRSACPGFFEVTFRPTGDDTGDGDIGFVQLQDDSGSGGRAFPHEIVNSLTTETPISV